MGGRGVQEQRSGEEGASIEVGLLGMADAVVIGIEEVQAGRSGFGQGLLDGEVEPGLAGVGQDSG